MPSDTNLAWIDLETTGARSPDVDPIIEVGLVVTDLELNELDRSSWVVRPSDDQWPDTVDGFVVRMHARNGLWSEVISDGLPVDRVDAELAATLDHYTINGKIALAGSGVGHFDGQWIRAQMPESAKRLTYWSLDIGVVRRFATRILGEPEQSGPVKSHRALADAAWHAQEARHWAGVLGA